MSPREKEKSDRIQNKGELKTKQKRNEIAVKTKRIESNKKEMSR